jgi:hypothetical protein
LDKAVLEKGKNGKTEFWHWFDYIVGVVTAEKELWRSDNTVPERRKNVSDPYPAFFLLIATTSNKNFLKVQKL